MFYTIYQTNLLKSLAYKMLKIKVGYACGKNWGGAGLVVNITGGIRDLDPFILVKVLYNVFY